MKEPKQSIWDRQWDITTPVLNFLSRFRGERIAKFLRDKVWTPFTLRRVVFTVASVTTLIALFYSVENWRGKTAWEKHKREMAAKGVNLDWDSYMSTNQHLTMKSETKEVKLVRSVLQRSVVVVHNNSDARIPLAPYYQAMLGSTWPPEFGEMQRMREHGENEITRGRLLEFGAKPVSVQVKAFLGKTVRETIAVLAEESSLTIDLKRERHRYGNHPWLRDEMIEQLAGVDSLELLMALLKAEGLTLVHSPVTGVYDMQQEISLATYRAWYELNRPWLDSLFAGLDANGVKLDVNADDPLRSAIPNFVAIRTLTQTLTAGAQLAILDGAPDQAVRYLGRILELTELLNEGHRSVAGTMTRSSCVFMAGYAAANGFQKGVFQSKHLDQLREMFGEINLIKEYVRTVNEGERLQMAFGMERFSRDDLMWMYGNPKLVDEKGVNWFHVALRCVPRGWIYQNLLSFDDVSQKFMEAIDLQNDRVDIGLINQYANEVEQHDKDRTPYFFLARRSIINHQIALQHLLMNQAALRQLIIACSLEDYRSQHGEYPENLEGLVPKYLAKIPADVIDGKPMRYRLEGKAAFVLYSIGWDQKDEGGVVKETRKATTVPKLGFTFYRMDRTQGDWVFRSKPLQNP